MFACFYSSCIYSFARVCFCRFNKVVVNSSDGGREVLERKESLLIWSWKRCQWRDVGCLNGKGFCPRGLRGYVSSLTEVNFSILALTWHARTSPAPLLTKHDSLEQSHLWRNLWLCHHCVLLLLANPANYVVIFEYFY